MCAGGVCGHACCCFKLAYIFVVRAGARRDAVLRPTCRELRSILRAVNATTAKINIIQKAAKKGCRVSLLFRHVGFCGVLYAGHAEESELGAKSMIWQLRFRHVLLHLRIAVVLARNSARNSARKSRNLRAILRADRAICAQNSHFARKTHFYAENRNNTVAYQCRDRAALRGRLYGRRYIVYIRYLRA